jgi:hypothetical protein
LFLSDKRRDRTHGKAQGEYFSGQSSGKSNEPDMNSEDKNTARNSKRRNADVPSRKSSRKSKERDIGAKHKNGP